MDSRIGASIIEFVLEQRSVDWTQLTWPHEKFRPSPDMFVDDVMRRWPSTIRVFLDFRMRCVGCPIAAFHSIDEACEEHEVDASDFLPRILEVAA